MRESHTTYILGGEGERRRWWWCRAPATSSPCVSARRSHTRHTALLFLAPSTHALSRSRLIRSVHAVHTTLLHTQPAVCQQRRRVTRVLLPIARHKTRFQCSARLQAPTTDHAFVSSLAPSATTLDTPPQASTHQRESDSAWQCAGSTRAHAMTLFLMGTVALYRVCSTGLR